MCKDGEEQLNAFKIGDSIITGDTSDTLSDVRTVSFLTLKLEKNLRLFNDILDKMIRDIKG